VIDASLETSDKVRDLQIKLYQKAEAPTRGAGQAKNEPGFRFYQLYDKMYRSDVLLRAWTLAKANQGAPGVDGKSFADIESEGVTEWLTGLGKELHDKTYQPQPVRRVMIPKPGGGERALGIPTIRDRVAQTAAKLILEPIFEADLEPNAYGYRPRRSAQDAIQKVDELLHEGYTDIVDADLLTRGEAAWVYLSGDKDANSSSLQCQYFDTIPHSELMQCVARRIVDKHMLHLVKMWLRLPQGGPVRLKVPVEETDEKGNKRLTGGKDNDRGTPQAAPLKVV
jgi:RNA-directed DNA polymerase